MKIIFFNIWRTGLSILGDLIFLNFFLSSGNIVPISFFLIAPNKASIIECKITSPSECPFNPEWNGIFKPPKYNFLFFISLWISNPIPKYVFVSITSSLNVILLLKFSPLIKFIFKSLLINSVASSWILFLWFIERL